MMALLVVRAELSIVPGGTPGTTPEDGCAPKTDSTINSLAAVEQKRPSTFDNQPSTILGAQRERLHH